VFYERAVFVGVTWGERRGLLRELAGGGEGAEADRGPGAGAFVAQGAQFAGLGRTSPGSATC